MAKRFTKPSINWAEIEKRVPPEQRPNFFAFKGKSDVYLRRVMANPPELPKIDWEAYKKSVPVAGLVDKFKSEYEAFKVPFPADNVSASIDQEWATIQSQIKEYIAKSQAKIEEVTKELAKVKALPPFESMTMEMVLDMYPDEALDPVNRPTFWPHAPDDQLGYDDDKKAH